MLSHVSMKEIEQQIEKNQYVAIVPVGTSMWPFIKNKSQSVVLKKIDRTPKLYDVVFFKRESGAYVLHRVIDFNNDNLIVCGDSQYYTEEVEVSKVIAIMEGFYEGKKYIACDDAKYLKRVKKWYSRKFLRKISLKLYHLRNKIN